MKNNWGGVIHNALHCVQSEVTMSLFLIFELSWPMFGKLYVNVVLECTHLNVQER